MSVFGKGSYWYKVPTATQYSEVFSDKDHEVYRRNAIEKAKEIGETSAEDKPDDSRKFFFRDAVMDGKYINPLILFLNNKKLVVSVDASDEYEEGEIPSGSVCDFMFDRAIPFGDLKKEIQNQMGVFPMALMHFGIIELNEMEEVANILYRDCDIDEEEKEDAGDEKVGTYHIDVFVCSEWDGEFKLEEGYMPAVIGLNEFDKYGLDWLVDTFGNPNNYLVWARILNQAGLLD